MIEHPAVIVVGHASAAASTTSIRGFLNDLGVALFERQDTEGFAQQYTETTSTALVAPFACLPSLMGRSVGSSAQTLRLPRSIQRVFFHSYDPELCPEGTLQELLRAEGAQLAPLKTRPLPRWTPQNRPFRAWRLRLVEFYLVASVVRKSDWIFVRQLRGPHLRTWP